MALHMPEVSSMLTERNCDMEFAADMQESVYAEVRVITKKNDIHTEFHTFSLFFKIFSEETTVTLFYAFISSTDQLWRSF